MGQRVTVREKLRRGLDQLYDDFPYTSSIASLWEIIPDPGCGTAWTNGPQLGYDPAWIDTLSVPEVRALLIHEVFHILLGHHLRREGREITTWQKASDAALNDVAHDLYELESDFIGKIQMILPGKGEFAGLPKGKTMEFYYDAVYKKPEPQPEPEPDQQDDDGDTDDEGDNESQGGQGGAESDPDASEGEGEASGSGDQSGDGPADESGESEGDAPTEQGTGDPKQDEGGPIGNQHPGEPTTSMGDVREHPGIEAGENKAEIEQEWEETVARAINNAKEHGTLPGWLDELGEKLIAKRSKVAWKDPLKRFVTKVAAGGGHTYSRPNRRNPKIGNIIMPSNRSPQAADLGALVDTSGSMDKEDLELVFPEIEGIFRHYKRTSITLFQCDTRLQIGAEKRYTVQDFPLKVPPHWLGRGGTNLGPAIAEIAKMRKFKALIVISDMRFPASLVENPGIPVLWVCTVPIVNDYYTPKFGQIIGPLRTEE